MSVTKLTAIRQLPDRAHAVPNGRLTDKVEWLRLRAEIKQTLQQIGIKESS
jgi:hypothetical protein